MGQRSFASRLPKDLRTELDRLIVDGALTVDEVWAWLRARDIEVGRSSVHRHMASVEEVSQHMRQAREAAAAIVQQLGPDAADGQTGQLLTEVVQTIAFRTASNQMQRGEDLDMEDLHFLAKAVKDLASAKKVDTDRTLSVRRELAKEASKKLDAGVRAGEIDADAVAKAKRILGFDV